ncbi:macrolide family glycosyltransferase [Dietzia psychralcaliphila]|uniref:Erythromycin biosynthesis protein CIII-like C-terminal domain-containing protein n=1 Tax=Dietzia psychralcaliphila TaxID=139021 RepID=A0AAD0JSZ0_9ACTN|nr:macrolide family glycosyltransferase [Dietzia psychralcaliphila]AWH96002.1 hypothetical protein A6048_11410 [Dietzia psychralcaliphila]PTM90969.1 MGT family glycosyltransferase [Dietzia psychralcaliphila]
MAHVLYVVHPDHGHVIPTVAVVGALLRRGHRVSYLTGPRTAAIAREAGAEVLEYASEYRDHDFGRSAGELDYLMSVLLRESSLMLDAARAAFVTEVPDVVVYDTSVLFCGRVLSRVWDIPAVQLVPMFASNAHYSYLRAIGAEEHGGALPESEAAPSWIDPFLEEVAEVLAAHGVEEDPAALWWAAEEPTIVTMPRELQPAGETFGREFTFVGPCLGDRSFLGSWQAGDDSRPLALVSLGAVFNDHPEVFRICMEAFRDTRWRVVMTTADALDPVELDDVPGNVELRRWVPHIDVLAHAEVAVTHGGMGTVLEALATATPMVVTATSAMDRVTGRRVEEIGVGLDLDLAELDADRLRHAVERVAGTDFRRAAAEIAERISRAGGTERAAEVIDAATAIPTVASRT